MRDPNEDCIVIAYWGDQKDVLFTSSDVNSECNELFWHMQQFLTEGYRCEILEVIWSSEGWTADMEDICKRWRKVLSEQGYVISRWEQG